LLVLCISLHVLHVGDGFSKKAEITGKPIVIVDTTTMKKIRNSLSFIFLKIGSDSFGVY
jgi:hypothetical protein